MTERVIVPREATEEMWAAGEDAVSESFSMKYGRRAAAGKIIDAMLAASPNAGEVTEEELEKAAAILFVRMNGRRFSAASMAEHVTTVDALRAALASLGIKVGG